MDNQRPPRQLCSSRATARWAALLVLLCTACSDGRSPAAQPEPRNGPGPSSAEPSAPTTSAPATTDTGTARSPAAKPARSCKHRKGRSGDATLELRVGNDARSSLLHVPASYDPDEPTPLLLTFHGKGGDGAGAAYASNMTRSSDAHGFIVAYPNGADDNWNCCNNTPYDDVAFIDALITRISTDYCIDAEQVFAAGFSNGGYMSYRLMCELSARIAGIAVLEGALAIQDCKPERPVPVIQFHGTEDDAIPYEEAVQASERARQLDGCMGMPAIAYERGEVRCQLWSHCAEDSAVELCTIRGGGHQWTGGNQIDGLGHLSRDLDATSAIVDFLFGRH